MPKFNPKDLSYDQSLPPFLAALRGQLQGNGRGPDPILAGRRRAAKKRSASEEAEDAPLVVDEHGHAVDVAQDGPAGTAGADANEKPADAKNDDTKEKEADNVAFGAGKKRRVGKVVGGDEYEAADRELKRKRSEKEDSKKKDKDSKNAKNTKDVKKEKSDKKPKKEKKKIQLSFEDDED